MNITQYLDKLYIKGINWNEKTLETKGTSRHKKSVAGLASPKFI